MPYHRGKFHDVTSQLDARLHAATEHPAAQRLLGIGPFSIKVMPLYGVIGVAILAITIGLIIGLSHPHAGPQHNQVSMTPPHEMATDQFQNEAKRRIIWGTCVVVMGFMFAISISAAIRTNLVCPRTSPARNRRWRTFFALSCAGFVAALAFHVLLSVDLAGEHSPAGYQQMLLQAHITPNFFVSIYTALAMGTILLLAFGFMATILPANRRRLRARHIAASTRHAQQLLYIGSLLLAAGTIQVYALHSWPNAMLVYDHQPSKTVSDEIASVLAGGFGAVFSLVLLAMYLPAAVSLQCRAYQMAYRYTARRQNEETFNEWLERQGLMISPIKHTANAIALLSPLLAGMFTPSALTMSGN